VQGAVLDLEGRGRSGFELFDPRAPEETLATSDELGGFRLALGAEPVRVEARTLGWTTIVPALLAPGVEPGPALVVARAQDLQARVHDEAGRPIGDAELALCCDEGTFARIPLPVRVESERLRVGATDQHGRALLGELPRGPGLTLRVTAPGYEPLELDSRALGGAERFFLRPLDEVRLLAGSVSYRDGRPAAGAHVTLGRESTVADRLGRYRLPLIDVRPDSSLRASDPAETAAPVVLRGFGARLTGGLEEVDLVLGEEFDPVEGRLVGEEPEGWLVVAFSCGDAHREPQGNDEQEPAASTRSAADGRFAFRLPRGSYDLYTVAPDAPSLVRREALETRGGPWEIELPSDPTLQGFHAALRTVDGAPLARARAEVRLRLDGGRRVTWRSLTSDDQGTLAFARDPALPLELALTHAALGGQAIVPAPPGEHPELPVPRASFLQVADAHAGARAASVLDADGRALSVRGPLRSGEEVALRAGWSPVLAVPPEARWLALQDDAGELVRLPIEPRPGAVVQVRP
jgi:hypothetical protein